MPYLAPTIAPDGTYYEEEIPTPEEEAMLLSAGGYGPAPIPAPVAPPSDTSMYAAPVQAQYQPGGANYLPPYTPPDAGAAYGMGVPAADPAVVYAQSQPTDPYNTAPSGTYPSDPIPSPAYNFDAAEPYGMSAYAIEPARGSERFRLRSQENYTPPASGVNQEPAASQALRDLFPDEGMTTQDILNSRLPEPQTFYDEEGNEVAGVGEAAFIFGPIGGMGAADDFLARYGDEVAAGRAARTAASRSVAGAVPETVPPTTPPARTPSVVNAEAPGPRTFPRVAGRPGTSAGPGMVWGPNGEVIPLRQSQLGTRPPIELPAAMPEAPPNQPIPEPPGAAEARLAAAGQRGYDAVTGTTLAQRIAAPLPSAGRRTAWGAPRARTTTAAATPPASPAGTSATTPSPAVGGATRAGRGVDPKRLAALLGVGAVGGGIVAANRLGGGEVPGSPATVTDPAALPVQPGEYSPSTNPQTPDEWEGATTRSLELMKGYSPQDWAAGTRRVPVEIGGVPQKLIESTTTPGLYVGYVDVDGTIVPVGSDVPPEEFIELVIANAAEAPPGWGDDAGIAPPGHPLHVQQVKEAAGASTAPSTLADVSIPAPADSGGGSSRSSGGGRSTGWIDYGDNDGFGSSERRWNDYEDDDGDDEREFTADDFMDQANGDRRRAEMMARFANKRRRRRGSQGMDSGGMWPGFPFNRPPSPIRANILASLGEAFAEAFPNRGR